MLRYWVIAPNANDELYDAVWTFDLANDCISIGWLAAGDVSGIDRDELLKRIAAAYAARSPQSHAQITRMIWAFSHEVSVGDIVIARRGLRILAGIGDVTAVASFTPERNPEIDHPRFLKISWRKEPRNKCFTENKFLRPTIIETTEADVNALLDLPGTVTPDEVAAASPGSLRFVLERHLQEFIAGNWRSIFPDLDFFEGDGAVGGQPYETTDAGAIDILAVDRATRDFVILELKRDSSSDKVVGQVLRYMGWVKQNLCIGEKASCGVRGMIVCLEEDRKLNYAHSMTQNVELKYYDVSFKLNDRPATG